MLNILVSPKDALTKGVKISGYINPQSSYNTLMLNGLSMEDLIKIRDYQLSGFVSNNSVCIDLNKFNFDILY